MNETFFACLVATVCVLPFVVGIYLLMANIVIDLWKELISKF